MPGMPKGERIRVERTQQQESKMTSLLVTGGTGSFGHAFIPQALSSGRFSRIAILSRDEHKQHEFRRELGDDPRLRWFIGDVRDKDRLVLAFRDVDAVVHGAALKHVISGEYNPLEHIATNIMGAQNVVRAAIDVGVSKVLALSSDKACEPINLYGATKMAMEKLLIASNALAPGRTAFSFVRYGNVIGSRGSFVELLKKLQADGAKSFPLRSAESTRFWMTVSEAAQFVLDRLFDMQGGEGFVPKLPSSTALDFARKYLPDAEPKIVGLPRGEKVHETLISQEEWEYTEDMGTYFRILPNGPRHAPPAGLTKYASNENPFQQNDAQDDGGATPGGKGMDNGSSMPDRGEFLRRVRTALHW